VLVASFALALCACGEVDIIDHDPLLLVPEGNFPAAAEERCGPLPSDVMPIEGLTTAWAMTGVPKKDGDTSFRAATSQLVLRLSDDGVPCEGLMQPEQLGCPHAWGVDLVVRNVDPRPGVFGLDDYGQGYDLSTAYREEGECLGEQSKGGFATGELEIFTVTDDCVVGRLLGTADVLEAAGSPVEGGFVALRCDPNQ
jgi:hypothetical protein